MTVNIQYIGWGTRKCMLCVCWKLHERVYLAVIGQPVTHLAFRFIFLSILVFSSLSYCSALLLRLGRVAVSFAQKTVIQLEKYYPWFLMCFICSLVTRRWWCVSSQQRLFWWFIQFNCLRVRIELMCTIHSHCFASCQSIRCSAQHQQPKLHSNRQQFQTGNHLNCLVVINERECTMHRHEWNVINDASLKKKPKIIKIWHIAEERDPSQAFVAFAHKLHIRLDFVFATANSSVVCLSLNEGLATAIVTAIKSHFSLPLRFITISGG